MRAGAVLLVVSLAAPAAHAATFTLSDAQKAEAVRVGERSVTSEAFDREWRVSNGRGESVSVMTPFHRLTLAGRHAGFKKEALKRAEADRLLREQAGRLVLWVNVIGKGEDFARFYQPRLKLGAREIKPAFVQNERTASRQADGSFLARCVYGFPLQDLTGTSRLALVVADGDGRDVSTFTIDLSTMR